MPPVMRIVRRLALLVSIFLAVAIAVFFVVRSVAPDVQTGSLSTSDVTYSRERTEGGAQFEYRVPDDKTPRTPEERQRARPLTLIPERQTQPDPPVTATPREREDIAAVIDRILPAWETFSPGMNIDTYRGSLSRDATAGALSQLVARRGANQTIDIGPCATCTTGSEFARDMPPSEFMTIRDLDTRNAYVTTQGEITYTRSARSGEVWRRSYAVLLERVGRDWRVTRIASDTLGRG